MSASAVFVSDIHITSPDGDRGRLFLEFLRSLSGDDLTDLYLLGDIFDLWVADHRYFIDRYADIVDEIGRLKREGVEINYFEGNHDLYLRHFWHNELGVTVHEGPTQVTLCDTQVRLEHGDQTDPDDRGYLFLRWFLRTPPIRFLNRHLPGRFVARLGDRASASSRQYTTHTKSIEPTTAVAKLRDHARRVYAEQPFDLIITGHVHVRDDCEIETDEGSFRAVNLGSWFDRPCYFRLDEHGAGFVELGQAATEERTTHKVQRSEGAS